MLSRVQTANFSVLASRMILQTVVHESEEYLSAQTGPHKFNFKKSIQYAQGNEQQN